MRLAKTFRRWYQILRSHLGLLGNYLLCLIWSRVTNYKCNNIVSFFGRYRRRSVMLVKLAISFQLAMYCMFEFKSWTGRWPTGYIAKIRSLAVPSLHLTAQAVEIIVIGRVSAKVRHCLLSSRRCQFSCILGMIWPQERLAQRFKIWLFNTLVWAWHLMTFPLFDGQTQSRHSYSSLLLSLPPSLQLLLLPLSMSSSLPSPMPLLSSPPPSCIARVSPLLLLCCQLSLSSPYLDDLEWFEVETR